MKNIFSLTAAFLVAVPTGVNAQIALPDVTLSSVGAYVLPLSAAEADYHVSLNQARIENSIPFRQVFYPKDSLLRTISSNAKDWLTRVQANAVMGIQFEPAARVGMTAKQEAYAKSQITERLSTPGLSMADKAFTYVTAVKAFSSDYYPAGLPLAEEYLRQLEKLGDSTAAWQFEAHAILVDTYYRLGKSSDIVRHGIRAIELVNIIPFPARGPLVFPGGGGVYSALVDVLSGQPGGRAKIQTINNSLRKLAVPPAALAALDSGYVIQGQIYQSDVRHWISSSDLLGTKGTPIIANYWVNRPSRDSASVAVDDGKIRVLEMGTYGCPPCILALYGMQRIQNLFSGIEVTMVTWTYGSWGNRLVPAEEEASHLEDFFLNTAKVTIPIAIWKSERVVNEDGGFVAKEFGPMLKHYPVVAKPMIWILDGNGSIRRVFMGYSRDTEEQIAKTVSFLMQEAKVIPLVHQPSI